jgi:hypothetical protein
MKNIRQTELIIDLRNAIYQVCKQFSQCSENHERVVLSQADYSLSDETDRTEFIKGRREGKKRARALLDFEKSDDDDLGFLKNDVLSEKDENRWTGELNGEKGLFPTKFVELVRGPLALAFKQILCHGLKKPNGIASSFFHPWQFIGI